MTRPVKLASFLMDEKTEQASKYLQAHGRNVSEIVRAAIIDAAVTTRHTWAGSGNKAFCVHCRLMRGALEK